MVQKLAEEYGTDDLVVILGAPSADSAELYAETLINGDPSWVGPLAGVSLGLAVYHIMELEIKAQIDPELFKQHLELMEIALDVEGITKVLNQVRNSKDNNPE